MFPYTLTDKVATLFIDGKQRLFANTHPSYTGILAAIESGNEAEIRALVDVKASVKEQSFGRVEILDNTVLVGGREVTGRLIDRILEMVSRGSSAVEGYVKFLDKLMENPSKKAVDELYLFIEACTLPITPEGNFLAYKRVGSDYMSLYTYGNAVPVDNHVGNLCDMPRNEVDDERDNVCSNGLHFCSYDYLPAYGGSGGNRVVVVEINPKNVVSIPSDYNNAKGRTCEYIVVGEIEDWVGERITPYFTDEYDHDDEDADLDDDMDSDLEELFAEVDLDSEVHAILNADLSLEDEMAAMEELIHEDNVKLVIPAPKGIRAHISEGGVSVVVSENVPQTVIDNFMETIEARVKAAEKAAEVETDTPEPIAPAPVVDATPTPKRGKLTPDQVRSIRKYIATGGYFTYAEIGEKFGVHRRTIEKIDHGDIWSSVT